jgi:hypothetical protein
MRPLQIVAIAFVLLVGRAMPSSAQTKSTGIVTSSTAEFRIPLTRPTSGVWTWYRPATQDNALEYSWEVSVSNGVGSYEFGFYLYKFPGSNEKQGQLQELLRAGQMSAFESSAEGQGKILPDAKVAISVENDSILIRITDPALVRLIFRDRPVTVNVSTKTPDATFETLPITFRE